MRFKKNQNQEQRSPVNWFRGAIENINFPPPRGKTTNKPRVIRFEGNFAYLFEEGILLFRRFPISNSPGKGGRENVPLEREERHSSRIIKQNGWCLAVIVRGTSWIDNSRRGKYGRFSKGSNPTFKQQVKILFHPLCRGIFPSRIYYRIVFLFTITYEKGKMR